MFVLARTGRKVQFSTKCTCFVKQIKRIAIIEKKKNRSFQERCAAAKDFVRDPKLLHNINKLSRHARNFLFMQLRLADKTKKALRFTTEEKLWSLSVLKESPKGYRFLQKMFNLPTKRTLNRLAENISFKTGINENIFMLLKQKAADWNTITKLCSIVFDEVALTPHLTFVESYDEVVGFKDLGTERYLKYADHALVFMVRGICTSWRQPIAYFFCEGTISAPHLVKILKEIVDKLSNAGLIPLALICDQGSTFRTAINMLRKDTARERILLDGKHDAKYKIHFDGPIEKTCKCSYNFFFFRFFDSLAPPPTT